MARPTSQIIGGLLSRDKINMPQKQTAVERRLQSEQAKPVGLLVNELKQREAAVPLNTGGGEGAAIEFSSGGHEGEGLTEAAFNKALQKMIADSGHKVSITSGKRDPQKQKDLWAKALKKYGDPEIADNWVARPGTSKHESGLAADLKFADDATKKWFHQNAAKYGLYFPMSHEPWHIQLKAAAKNSGHSHAPSGGGGGGVVQRKPGQFYTGDPNIDFIIDGESRGNPTAKNKTSSAFGIGQMIKANRVAYGKRFGFNPDTTDPAQQITMMKAYIKDRYGTPEAAAAFKRKHGWY